MKAKPSLKLSDASCAIIILADGRFLLQLRDDKPEIFYPNHWGLFGGAIELGESDEEALKRELFEEIALPPESYSPRYFSRHDFDFSFAGSQTISRIFFEVYLTHSDINSFILNEGEKLAAFHADDIIEGALRVVPYDAFALWTYIEQGRLEQK